jgi:hypothetical protein
VYWKGAYRICDEEAAVREPYPEETWLAPGLVRNLEPVSAPDELWRRIQHPRVVRVQKPAAWLPVAVVPVVILIALVWGFLPHRTLSARALAIQALDRGPENLELQSETSSDIRAWVKTRTGLELPLPSETSRMVRLKGVCAVKGGVQVAYRVSGHNAALVVSKASQEMNGDGKHRFVKCESSGSTRVSSWIMRGQLYTLAYSAPGNLRDECLLCHAEVGSLTAVN